MHHPARYLCLIVSWVAWDLCVACHRPAGEVFAPIAPAVVWPAAPETARIRLIGSIRSSGDLKAESSGWESFKAALRGPRPAIRFSAPNGVACHGAGLLAVADTAAAAVHILDFEHRTHLVSLGDESQRFSAPVGVAWMGDHLLVSDAQAHEIVELNREGRVLNRFGAAELRRPVGLVYVYDRHQVFVVDGDDHCVKSFSDKGALLKSFGHRGSGPGEYNYPTFVAYDGERLLAVADTGNFRVQLLDLDGNFLGSIGQKGDAAGDLALPKGVAFDDDGHLYVVDAQFENFQIFDRRGELLLAVGQEGSGPGEFALPAGMCMNDRNWLWVADSANRRIQVFEYVAATDSATIYSTRERFE